MKKLKHKIVQLVTYFSAIATSVTFSGCEEIERPDPVNLQHYDVTEISISFDQYEQPSYVSFLAVKPDGNECTTGPQSVLEYEININDNLADFESFAFVAFDFMDYNPRDRFGNGFISGEFATEVNTPEGVISFDFRDCARSPDAMVLMMDNARFITNMSDSTRARFAINNIDESGEYNVASSGAAYTQGDFTP